MGIAIGVVVGLFIGLFIGAVGASEYISAQLMKAFNW